LTCYAYYPSILDTAEQTREKVFNKVFNLAEKLVILFILGCVSLPLGLPTVYTQVLPVYVSELLEDPDLSCCSLRPRRGYVAFFGVKHLKTAMKT
jgi:hypothetical protein